MARSSSTAVAPVEAPAVPALAPTPASQQITAEDIVVPRLYVGNYMSKLVKRKVVNYGDIYLAAGAEDPDAQVLWEAGSDKPGVLVHVLGMVKRRSYSPSKGAPPISWHFEDPTAHPDAWTTYNYTLFLPEVDPDMPAKLLLTKTSRGTAQRINTVLARSASAPLYSSAFRLTSAERSKDDNEWTIFEARQVPAEKVNPDHVGQAAVLYELVAPGLEREAASRPAETSKDEPEI